MSRALRAASSRLDQFILAYLAAPLIVYVVGALRPLAAVIAVILLAIAGAPMFEACRTRGSGKDEPARRRINPLLVLLLAAFSVLWAAIGGAGHLFYKNFDWLKHDAVLWDLARYSWPVTYGQTAGHQLVLRYYDGLYTVPAAAFKIIGGDVANWLWAWISLGVFLVLLRTVLFVRSSSRAFVVLVAFAVFGGLDIVGYMSVYGTQGLQWSLHLARWDQPLVFNGNATALYWVPQHALSAWLATLLIVDRKDSARVVGMPFLLVVVCFWSIFSAIGLLPFVGVIWIRHLRRNGFGMLLHPSLWASIICGMALGAYLMVDSGGSLSMWLWDFAGTRSALELYVSFLCLELFGLVVVMRLAGFRFDYLSITALMFLGVLPWYVFGYADDLVMRASLPALFVVFLVMRQGIENYSASSRALVRVAPLLIVVLVSSAGVFTETDRALTQPNKDPLLEGTPAAVLAMAGQVPEYPSAQYFARLPISMARAFKAQDPILDSSVVEVAASEWKPYEPASSYFQAPGPQKGKVSVVQTAQGVAVSSDGTRPAFAVTNQTFGPGYYRLHARITTSIKRSWSEVWLAPVNGGPLRATAGTSGTVFDISGYMTIQNGDSRALTFGLAGYQGTTATLESLTIDRLSTKSAATSK